MTRQRAAPAAHDPASIHPARSTNRKVDGVQEISGIMTRLRDAASLPDTLAAGFDAFEAIRQLARDCEDRVPALFAAFMTTADAAVDGREAITIAPALPRRGRPQRRSQRARERALPVEEIAGALAGARRAAARPAGRAAAIAATAGDRAACTERRTGRRAYLPADGPWRR